MAGFALGGHDARMPRMPRFFVPGAAMHVVQRGANRAPAFVEAADFTFYRQCLAFSARTHGVAVHAYVLMTNHVHLLVTPGGPTSVARMMQSIGRVYVPYFNAAHSHSGTLWEGRYRATIVDADTYLLTCMRYIELNPVRAGMVAAPGDYPWSSFAANALGELDEALTPHPLYRQLANSPGERRSIWRGIIGVSVAEPELAAIRDATQHAWALGNASFRAQAECFGRRAQRMPPSRRRDGRSPSGGSDPTS